MLIPNGVKNIDQFTQKKENHLNRAVEERGCV